MRTLIGNSVGDMESGIESCSPLFSCVGSAGLTGINSIKEGISKEVRSTNPIESQRG